MQSPDIISKTHDSELQDQEEAGHTQQRNELFTHSTALKFGNTLDNYISHHESYRLASYQGLSYGTTHAPMVEKLSIHWLSYYLHCV